VEIQSLQETTDVPYLYGMDAIRAALPLRAPKQRSISWLSKELGLSRGAMRQWDRVPEEHIKPISDILGIPPSVLRPDLAELFS
jgi:hypothetical protein